MAMPDATVNKNLEGGGFRARVQRFGGYLAGMIMPNIGAFIAWGLITALFIPTGWLPNASSRARRPDDHVPAADADRLHRRPDGARPARRCGRRVATIGVIMGTDVPMFLGA